MFSLKTALDWIEHGLTYQPTQYRLYGRRFLKTAHKPVAGASLQHFQNYTGMILHWNQFIKQIDSNHKLAYEGRDHFVGKRGGLGWSGGACWLLLL